MSFRGEQDLPEYEMKVVKNRRPLTLEYYMVLPTILSFDFQPEGGIGFGVAEIPEIGGPGVVFHNSSIRPVEIAIESGSQSQNITLKPNLDQDQFFLLGHSVTFDIHLGEYSDKANARVVIKIRPPARG